MRCFCDEKELAPLRRRVRRLTLVFGLLAFAAAALFVLLCLLTRTANAARMLWAAILSMVALGWLLILLGLLVLRPAHNALRHLEDLATRPTEDRTGRFFILPGSVQIPKSVRVCPVRLETEDGKALRLNLDESRLPDAPGDGALVRLRTVGAMVAGWEVLQDAPAPAKPRGPSRFRRFRRAFSLVFPLCMAWLALCPILTGFVFARITDTDPAHKLSLYADADLKNAPELAGILEDAVTDPVRMVKVRPFSYAMFGRDELAGADLYLIPASRAAEYAEWLAPAPESLRSRTEKALSGGIPVFDPARGLSAASAWVDYDPALAPYALYFGASLRHASGEDVNAVSAALALLDLP